MAPWSSTPHVQIIILQNIPGNSSADAQNYLFMQLLVFRYSKAYCLGLSEFQFLPHQFSKIIGLCLSFLSLHCSLEISFSNKLWQLQDSRSFSLSDIRGLHCSCPMSGKQLFHMFCRFPSCLWWKSNSHSS